MGKQRRINELYKQIQQCKKCELSENTNPIYYRGDINSKFMIIGEGPGLVEEREKKPLIGPAGQLLDKIFNAIQLNTDDFYITNVIKCRYVAPSSIRKQNLTPEDKHCNACKIYLAKEISTIKPCLIVLLGKVAINTVLPQLKTRQMKEYIGKINYNIKLPGIKIFTMYHPAMLLHNKNQYLKQIYWEHAKQLRIIINE